MPGRVIAVKVAPGQAVVKGEEVLVVEAMKMENALRAPRDGVVTNLGRLQAIVGHPAFRAGALHTGFLDEHMPQAPAPPAPPEAAVTAAALALQTGGGSAAGGTWAAAPDPWASLGAVRLP